MSSPEITFLCLAATLPAFVVFTLMDHYAVKRGMIVTTTWRYNLFLSLSIGVVTTAVSRYPRALLVALSFFVGALGSAMIQIRSSVKSQRPISGAWMILSGAIAGLLTYLLTRRFPL